MSRLTQAALTKWRNDRVAANAGRCGLCKLPIKSPCADHCHATGYMRDAICRSCNSLLGQIERGVVRFGVGNLSAFLHGAGAYIQRHQAFTLDTPMHPTHRTEEEKRERRNAMARKRRVASNDRP